MLGVLFSNIKMDKVELSESLKFDGVVLSKAIETTFGQRNTPLPTGIPNALTEQFTEDETKQKQWQSFLRKNRLDTSTSLKEIAEQIQKFLLPIIFNLLSGEEFNKIWSPEAGWTSQKTDY